MRLKKISYKSLPALLSVLCLPLLVWSCQKAPVGQSSASQETLDKIRQSRELHVGYYLLEPTIMEEPGSEKLKGVFVDMIEEIAAALDVKVVYHKEDLPNLITGLNSGKFDVSIGATFATPRRASSVMFSHPIFYTGYAGVVKKGKEAEFKKWQDFDRKGLKVALAQGSAFDDFVKKHFKNAEIIRLPGQDLTQPLAAVTSGQADVGICTTISCFAYQKEHPEIGTALMDNPIASTYFAWAVRPNDHRWLNFLNTSIDYHLNTGDFHRWASKYGIPLLHPKVELEVPEYEKYQF